MNKGASSHGEDLAVVNGAGQAVSAVPVGIPSARRTRLAEAALLTVALYCLIEAFILDWRVAMLMIAGWWADNMLRKLLKREAAGAQP